MICPLCLDPHSVLYDQDKFRNYFQCTQCSLVFVPRTELISVSDEKSRYEDHENSEVDPVYRKYLSEIIDAIVPYLSPEASGLDFGSGKTTLMADLLAEKNIQTESFDIYFHPNIDLLKRKYDFVILSEVIEHFRDPHKELQVLKELLNKDGYLIVKTMLLPDSKEKFQNWFYKRDRTHVQFFSQRTFEILENLFELGDVREIGKNLFLFRNN